MKEKSTFTRVIILIIIGVLCIALTGTAALLAGLADKTVINISELNFANVIPVLLIGGFISCVIIGIAVLFVSRSVFLKLKGEIKEHFSEEKDDGGKKQ